LGKLGEGAMGEVYKVRDLELDEVVALKRIPRSLGSEANLERLRREVRLARRIASAHVCRIFDIVDLGEGERGLTMEVIDGMTLAEHLEAGLSVDYQRFARWGAQVADGLAAAHQLNIVHRDLKPENIMIRRADDQALLLDFGIARPPDDAPVDTRLTQAGMIMGTPLYMSPEQLANAPLDARSDLYSLGLILAELITGQVPHQGRTYHEILHLRVRLTDPYLLRDVDPGAPAGLADVVDHLLKQAPADRPEDAEQVKLRLRAWLEGRPSTLPAPAPAEAPREAAMTSADAATVAVRSERPWWVAIALLIVVVAGLVASLVNQGPRPRTGSPDPDRQAAERLPVVDAGVSPEVTPVPAPDAGFSADAGAKKVWIPPAEEM
ncbi:MAG: serine/threonine protein kinase, partial [Myxococcales bacterium]|nr:serine/threonine protein kinase [Myxococcales bacterium]